MSRTASVLLGIVKWLLVPCAIGFAGYYVVGPMVKGESKSPVVKSAKTDLASKLEEELQAPEETANFIKPAIDVEVGPVKNDRVKRRTVRRQGSTRDRVDEGGGVEISDPAIDPDVEVTEPKPERPKPKRRPKRETAPKPEPKPTPSPSGDASGHDEAGSGGAATGGGEADPAGGN